MAARSYGKWNDRHDDAIQKHILAKSVPKTHTATETDESENAHTVKTASDTVPMIKASELLYWSMNGGSEPCCVNHVNQL